MNDVIANFTKLYSDIALTAKQSRRQYDEINLIAVSKNHSAEEIEPLLKHGHRVFGENRVQEAESKWPYLKKKYPDVKLHLIGPLQANKARKAIRLFDVIHTIDKLSLAQKINDACQQENRKIQVFIQVNTGQEKQKSGILPAEVAQFAAQCQKKFLLQINGLMCIPPIDEEASLHFTLLSKLAAQMRLPWLSMGMTADYRKAIEIGATHIRIGTAIFGQRKKSQ